MADIGSVIFGVFAVTFFGIIGGFILHKILSLYIEGAIGGLECVVIGGAYVGLILAIVTLNLIVAVPVAIGFACLLVYSFTQDRRIIRKLYDEQIVRFREALASDPKNLAARGRLAETLYKKHHLDEAIAEMSIVVQQSPESKHEAYLLREYIEELDRRKAPPIVCPSCGFSNSPDRTHCYNCEGSLKAKTEMMKWLAGGALKQIAIAWAITMAAIVIVVLALGALPIMIRIAVIALILIIFISAELLYAYRNF